MLINFGSPEQAARASDFKGAQKQEEAVELGEGEAAEAPMFVLEEANTSDSNLVRLRLAVEQR